MQDDRESKRLRRKQSNRESARRSRLRKQAECESLSGRVEELMTDNARLREANQLLQARVDALTSQQADSVMPKRWCVTCACTAVGNHHSCPLALLPKTCMPALSLRKC